MKQNKSALADPAEISKKELIQRAKKFSKKFCITDGKDFKLKDYDPGEDGGTGKEDKPTAKQTLQLGVMHLRLCRIFYMPRTNGLYS